MLGNIIKLKYDLDHYKMIREDLKISNKLMSVYNNINYYSRYKDLSEKYFTEEERLEKIDKKIVLNILSDLGYTGKYNSRESFFQIQEDFRNKKFYFNINLKYGLVELIFGLLDDIDEEKNQIIGGTACGVCELIEINKGQESNEYIKDPRFRTYEELKEILKEAFSLYEDLKKEVVKIYSL